ncbi:RIO kinase 2 [Fistulifera solaris]|uniref:Serine/threonine-protein kinase RIO2 n=1 Tax=Fistulifera solaris TaxID=1519565 RepID=A0A1Z5K4A5_FISSO|nr:RIO kinase 2 [Fistulifera solaris]|eukprot:GAX21077.1 RIO kinase 2 [Fistulifera solaris]
MKLDPTVLRTMHTNDFRVLEAVEQGMKNHALVPLPLVSSIANLRHGGVHKIVSSLLRDKLLSHEKKNGHDGYRITNAGYDILALHYLKTRKQIAALGQKVGTGKESDIYLGATPSGKQVVLKFHRLGRTSFRNVKKKRDYFGKAVQQAHSWLFLSRLSALKEYAFMKALHDVQYPTPTPIAQNRHVVVMSLVRGMPLYQIFPKQLSADQAADIYQQAIGIAARLARQHGLVHCDLNEFNLLVDLSGVQSLATQDSDDPYVRHSGQSVAGEKSMGALSKPAWEQSLEQGDDLTVMPEPAERLENGEPKPVVTLIDFPQMISIKHPNAQELYERDLACLRKFFEVKLHCQIPEDEEEHVSWTSIMALQPESVQTRLDSELKASGFSDAMGRGLELYYFDSGPHTAMDHLNEEGEEEEEEEESDNEFDDEHDVEEEQVNDNESSSSSDPVPKQDVKETTKVLTTTSKVEIDMDALALDDVSVDHDLVDLLDSEQLRSIAHSRALEHAKERVRRQLEEEKRKSRRQGAFRKGNKNKTYVKGKRVMSDAIF